KVAIQDKQFVKHVFRIVDIGPIRPTRLVQPDDLVESGKVGVAKLVGGDGEVSDIFRVAADLELGEEYTDLHLLPLEMLGTGGMPGWLLMAGQVGSARQGHAPLP